MDLKEAAWKLKWAMDEARLGAGVVVLDMGESVV